jgi:hypothetical protein
MGIIEQVAQMKAEEARAEGVESTTRLIAENLLRETKLSDEKIASLSNVSVRVIKKIKKGMASK